MSHKHVARRRRRHPLEARHLGGDTRRHGRRGRPPGELAAVGPRAVALHRQIAQRRRAYQVAVALPVTDLRRHGHEIAGVADGRGGLPAAFVPVKHGAARLAAPQHGQRRLGSGVRRVQNHRQVQRRGALHQGAQEGLVPARLPGAHGAVAEGVMRQADLSQGDHPLAVQRQLRQHRLHLFPGRIAALRVQAQRRPYAHRLPLLQVQNPAVGRRPAAHRDDHLDAGALAVAADGRQVGVGRVVQVAMRVDEGHAAAVRLRLRMTGRSYRLDGESACRFLYLPRSLPFARATAMPLAGAHADEVGLEFGKGSKNVEEHLAHGVGRIVYRLTQREFDTLGTQLIGGGPAWPRPGCPRGVPRRAPGRDRDGRGWSR